MVKLNYQIDPHCNSGAFPLSLPAVPQLMRTETLCYLTTETVQSEQ